MNPVYSRVKTWPVSCVYVLPINSTWGRDVNVEIEIGLYLQNYIRSLIRVACGNHCLGYSHHCHPVVVILFLAVLFVIWSNSGTNIDSLVLYFRYNFLSSQPQQLHCEIHFRRHPAFHHKAYLISIINVVHKNPFSANERGRYLCHGASHRWKLCLYDCSYDPWQ